MAGAEDSLGKVAIDLQELFVRLAKVCIHVEPDDVERYCLEWLAKQHGMKLERCIPLTRGHSIAIDDDISEFVNDISTAKPATTPHTGPTKGLEGFGYASSDECEEVRSVASYKTTPSNVEAVDDLTGSDLDEEEPSVSCIRSTAVRDDPDVVEQPPSVCHLFSESRISGDELEEKTRRYQRDLRMKSLFRAWDGDGSGAVDFVELVVALHKFDGVAKAGIDIQVASDALLQFVESDTERELKFSEFAKVIVLFAMNNFGEDFEYVADHMLAVATATSEEAVLRAADGIDVSELEAADKEEEEFLRETAKGVEDQVSNNIARLRTKRVGFPPTKL